MIRTKPIDLKAALYQLLSQRLQRVRFTREQEACFVASRARDRFLHFLFTAVMALVLFDLFLISDQYMVPDVFALSVTIRLYILTPFVLMLVIVGHFLRDWWLARTPFWLTELIGTVGTMAVAAGLGIVQIMTQSELSSFYRAGLLPVLVFGNLVQRLRFRYALASSLFCLGVYVYSMYARRGMPSPYSAIELPMLLLLVLVVIYTLISNHNLEMDERKQFLQAERAQALRRELEQTHFNLEKRSHLDALTGLANRRRFDAFLADTLVRAAQAGQAVALLLIDVDHFKAFNDRYGHPAGDQCLRLVAQALAAGVRGRDALLARWGGEEFAVVLRGLDADVVQSVAEDLRFAVQGQAMRHDASSTSELVTVSVGGAQVSGATTAEQIIGLADEALYKAKAQGRNRCVVVNSLGA